MNTDQTFGLLLIAGCIIGLGISVLRHGLNGADDVAPLADPDSRPSLAEQVRALPESEWERRHVAEALAVADFHNNDRFFDALADERDQLGGVA